MTIQNLIIGIDPDIKKSGFAVLDGADLSLHNLNFVEVINYFIANKDNIKKIVLEAGWLNEKSNFRAFIPKKEMAEKIAKDVGKNHQTGILMKEYAESLGIQVVEVKPTSKKKNADEFKRLSGYTGRTNPETRDAAMLILGIRQSYINRNTPYSYKPT